MKCVVEKCDNTNGVCFPNNEEEALKWIAGLKLLSHPGEGSIVCLDHFQSCDLNNAGEGDNLTNVLKKGAVPCIDRTTPTQQNENLSQKTDTSACRLCAGSECLKISIYESLENETISNIIMLCCHPITISENDGYPIMICSTCLQQLQDAFNFRKKCLETNELWCNRQKDKKRKQGNEDNNIIVKKQRTEHTIMPSKDNIDSNNTTYAVPHVLSDRCNEKSRDSIPRIIFPSEPPPLVLIDKSGSEKHNNKLNSKIQVKSEIPSKVKDNVGNTTFTLKKEAADQAKVQKANKVVIPDEVTVKAQKKFESSTGIYSCTITHGLQESVFVMADDYLFTFGLLKGATRHLRCVLPNCKAKAEQTLLDKDTYEDKISVKVPHSHKAPSDQLRKKHMFFHVMRKRMQHDKTLNIRNIYEEVCNQEPEIRQLVPLRNVINEICKHQVSNKLPRITSFDKFYEKIEDECFEKLHFTNTNKQFYQERFCTDDGCMAVVFCNTDVVENIGHCTLMYVDASFKIDTLEDFRYQLVTVLVWIDDSYYPILYALVNRKTQEIFKKIFQYLHDVLAPNLRPHEIVTDYEANLYYALGETKVDQTHITIGQVVEKLIELDSFLHDVYNKSDKKSFGRDLSSFQKKNVIRAWQYIETHPKININSFFQKVLGYIKCMENQLWIWGFYRYAGDCDDVLINAANSMYVNDGIQQENIDASQEEEDAATDETMAKYVDVKYQTSMISEEVAEDPTIVMEAVIDNDGGVVLQSNDVLNNEKLEKTFFNYVSN
ncbi:hypothetical protein Trydic_g9148 [Trypoxylus dichotomus]